MEAEEFIMRWINGWRDELMCAVKGIKVPSGTRQIKRSQDRGKDKRGSPMGLCKQRLLLPSSAGGGVEVPPVQRKL